MIIRPETDHAEHYPGIVSNVGLGPGDVFRIETAGGGGVGDPLDRSRERIITDLQDGVISSETASTVYGIDKQDAQAALDR